MELFEGIVLFSKKYKENDSLVKIFTKDHGKKMFFIKSGRKATNKLFAHLQPFTQHQYIGKHNQTGFSFISEAETQNLFPKVQESIYLQAVASYFVQLIDASIDDHLYSSERYQLLLTSLSKLNQGFEPKTLQVYFELKMLLFFGVRFDWWHCSYCRKKVEVGAVSILNHGVLCNQHQNLDRFHIPISTQKLKLIQLLVQVPIGQLNSLKLKEETVQSLQEILNIIYDEFVGIKLKSKKFLQDLEKYEKILGL